MIRKFILIFTNSLFMGMSAIFILTDIQQFNPSIREYSNIRRNNPIEYSNVSNVLQDNKNLYINELGGNKSIIEWIDKAKELENCPIEGIIDSNNKKSYGKLCFQEDTFKFFIRRYEMLKEATDTELMNFISDEEIQTELAYKMLSEDVKNKEHWHNTNKKIIKLDNKVINN